MKCKFTMYIVGTVNEALKIRRQKYGYKTERTRTALDDIMSNSGFH